MLAIPENAWYTSSRSAGANNCVEVAHEAGWTAVRDSKDKAGPILVVAAREWDAFIGTAGTWTA